MNTIQRRFTLFLFGCIFVRVLITILAKQIDPSYLPYMGFIALFPAFGFLFIFLTGSRKTGLEVEGDKIWWNCLRPLHSLLYFLFAYNAIFKNPNSWQFLAIDVSIGLISFLMYHYKEGNFHKLM
jgi:ABC-type iron transport system FetAB permease component